MKFLFALMLPALAAAGVWPESLGEWRRASVEPAAVSDRQLWNEYGFQQAETAAFELGQKKFKATAWRLQDATGALGAFEWQRPTGAKPLKALELSAETKDRLLVASGNYVVAFEGDRPADEELPAILAQLPEMYQAPLPALPGYLPDANRVPDSGHYVLGPAALARFEPRVPPSVAAFHLGAEAALADFRTPKGDTRLALFYYPTPQIAIQQYEAFSKLPGAMAKRTGPIIAVVMAPPDPDAAEHLLSAVRYQASVTMSEYVPTRRDNAAHLILTIFQLTGVLLLFALVSGLAFGGFRALFRRGAKGQEADSMILLHLRDRRE